MIYHIYDHNYQPWRKRMVKINGAFTYSQDICEYYLPHIGKTIEDEFGPGKIVVSTCAALAKYPPVDVVNSFGTFSTLVQFLHTYPHKNEFDIIEQTRQAFRHKFDRMVFVVAYKAYAAAINKKYKKQNIYAKFLPMRIGKLPTATPKGNQKRQAIWFGNVYSSKKGTYDQVVKACQELKVELITIREGKYYDRTHRNGRGISQHDAWQVCANAGVVFAVGRCALEAYAMGCEVVVAGDSYGGTVLDYSDWETQERTNFNGRVHTGFEEIKSAVEYSIIVAERQRIKLPYDLHCETVVSSGKVLWE